MNTIIYKTEKTIPAEQLQELFSSVGWMSANYPKRLEKAMSNSDTVISAWDQDQLVGLINAIDDGELTAYAHYLLINPKYQKMGIGRELIEQLKKKYEEYLYLILISEEKKNIAFYEKLGFESATEATPMQIIRL